MITWAARLSFPRLSWRRDRELREFERDHLAPTGLRHTAVDLSAIHDVPTVLARALTTASIPAHRRVASFTGAHSIAVRSADGRPVPWHVDGDHVGDDTEIHVSVEPGGVQVVA